MALVYDFGGILSLQPMQKYTVIMVEREKFLFQKDNGRYYERKSRLI
ncbi:hypothetical protein MNBD_GAMMA11-2536 [hydrothermal vent metagenome]|uniref:Uncharacterized protein n=1 Tax=hydrothermal vent metagenome TaxID=652676 RepID=A0A3B0XEH0_9ZZZZ